jgi:hypothetical protein
MAQKNLNLIKIYLQINNILIWQNLDLCLLEFKRYRTYNAFETFAKVFG